MTPNQPHRRAAIVRWGLLIILLPILAGLFWLAWQVNLPIWNIGFTPDGERLVSIDGEYGRVGGRWTTYNVNVWDAASGQNVHSITIDKPAEFVELSPDRNRYAFVDQLGRISVVDIETGSTIAEWTDRAPKKSHTLVMPSNEVLVSLTYDGDVTEVTCRNVETGKTTARKFCNGSGWLQAKPNRPNVVVFWSLDKENPTISLYDVGHGRLDAVADLTGLENFKLSPDGETFAVLAPTAVEIYGLADRKLRATMQLPRRFFPQYLYEFSDDGRLLAGINESRIGFVWETKSGKLLRRLALVDRLNVSDAAYYCFALPAGRQQIFTGGSDGIIRAWDLTTGKLLRRFPDRYIKGVAVGAAFLLWAVLWVYFGTQLAPRRPLVDVMLLHSILLSAFVLHTVRSRDQLSIHSYSALVATSYFASVAFGHLSCLTALLLRWWVQGGIRWSMRLAGLVAGLAILIGLLILIRGYEWVAWQVIVGAVSFIGLLAGLFRLQLRSQTVVREERSMNRPAAPGAKWQWPLRDVFLLITAAATFVAVARFIKPYSMPWWGVFFVLSNGVTLAITAFVASWAALGSMRWWLRMAAAIAVTAGLGSGLPVVFAGLPIFPWWWYLNNHAIFAALIFSSLLIFRVNGYRLERRVVI